MSDLATLTPSITVADSPKDWPRATPRRAGTSAWRRTLSTVGVILLGLLSLLLISILMLFR